MAESLISPNRVIREKSELNTSTGQSYETVVDVVAPYAGGDRYPCLLMVRTFEANGKPAGIRILDKDNNVVATDESSPISYMLMVPVISGFTYHVQSKIKQGIGIKGVVSTVMW